jgi:tRNA G18 (ribose-2'-O)-methylase SpoU
VATFIASADDPRLAAYRVVANPAGLLRAGLFVAEGRWVVERLLQRPQFAVHSVLLTPTAARALAGPLERARIPSDRVYIVEQPVMDGVAGYNIHRGCLALAHRPSVLTLDGVALGSMARVLVLEAVNNPDNVGGLFRSAAAFAADLVVLGPACGDPLYRKAIRTSMAATLDVPYVHAEEWPGALDTLAAAGIQTIAMTPAPDALPLEAITPHARVALLVGSEGAGLSAATLTRAHTRARIVTTDRVDSLNVTVAASIAMHRLFLRT